MVNKFDNIHDYVTFQHILNQLIERHRCCGTNELISSTRQRFSLKPLFDFAEKQKYLNHHTLRTFVKLNDSYQIKYLPFSSSKNCLTWILALILYIGHLIGKCFGMCNRSQDIQKDINRVLGTLPPPITLQTYNPDSDNTEPLTIKNGSARELVPYFQSIENNPEKLADFFNTNFPLYIEAFDEGRLAFENFFSKALIIRPKMLEVIVENMFVILQINKVLNKDNYFSRFFSQPSHFPIEKKNILIRLIEKKPSLLTDFMQICPLDPSIIMYLTNHEVIHHLLKIINASGISLESLISQEVDRGVAHPNNPYLSNLLLLEFFLFVQNDPTQAASKIISRISALNSNLKSPALRNMESLALFIDKNEFLALFLAFESQISSDPQPLFYLLAGTIASKNPENIQLLCEVLWVRLKTMPEYDLKLDIPLLFRHIDDAATASIFLRTFPEDGEGKWLEQLLTAKPLPKPLEPNSFQMTHKEIRDLLKNHPHIYSHLDHSLLLKIFGDDLTVQKIQIDIEEHRTHLITQLRTHAPLSADLNRLVTDYILYEQKIVPASTPKEEEPQ